MTKTFDKILTLFGGAFKPPTRGHFNIVKWSSDTLHSNEEYKLYVGEGHRDGVDQQKSILIWNIYKKYLNPAVTIVPSKSPIREIVNVAKKNPNDRINMVIGYRLGNKKDLFDLEKRTSNLPPNVTVLVHTSRDGVDSGSLARKAFKKSKNELKKYLPTQLNDLEITEIFDILKNDTIKK